ncbi:SDR family NAD(P)-dependent oxidoreductase [Chamaesiphon sp. VAR_69_metabat_338]|uniref:SDR family NAD(P)-dependent oxidoreductase n=1 Tax=Chamaesiphon sp. VAR_69_metabat_338 TaxID=2964704 RepID=UPI00286E21D1|nr:SDR family NAD(P)-dependent oxidoreductase [Chamaesiphon sp. VAR_69_metabat_338]
MNATAPARKRALVTGGNKGIGLAICQGLLAAEFEVILAARSIDKAKTALEKLQSVGRASLRRQTLRERNENRVHPLILDVADDESIERAAQDFGTHFPQLDVLINNAGIYPDEDVNILTIDRELLDRTMNTNTFGAIRTTQAFLPHLSKSPAARVINGSSGLGALAGIAAESPSYSLSKLALNGATIMLAAALKPQKIAVYSMCPGWVRTDMGGTSASRSPEQGADTAIWLATAATPDFSGKFFRDRQEIPF